MGREKLTKAELLDSNHVIRGCMKVSNCLLNIDNILDVGNLPRKLRQDFYSFSDFIESHTKHILDNMSAESPELTLEIQQWFSEIEEHFHLEDVLMKEFAMLFAKLLSMVDDLKKLNTPYMVKFAEPLISRSMLIVDRYNKQPFTTIHQESFLTVVEEMSNLGAKIITSEKGG